MASLKVVFNSCNIDVGTKDLFSFTGSVYGPYGNLHNTPSDFLSLISPKILEVRQTNATGKG